MIDHQPNTIYGTTILAVRRNGQTAIGGDGQVSLGNTVIKGDARKVRRIAGGRVVTGFAGATADAFTLMERLEAKLEQYPTQLQRACVELAKDWRTDRYLRRLEAMMIVADEDNLLTLSGMGDVLEPEDADATPHKDGLTAIGSGGNFAYSAALALMDNTEMSAEEIVKAAMKIAGKVCIYTNDSLTLETITK